MMEEINTTKVKSDGGSTSYYDFPEGAKTLMDLIEHRNMGFAQGNIFKAAYRLGRKAGVDDRYDLNKIIYFAQRELERLDKREARARSYEEEAQYSLLLDPPIYKTQCSHTWEDVENGERNYQRCISCGFHRLKQFAPW